jgi:hypothetical protein
MTEAPKIYTWSTAALVNVQAGRLIDPQAHRTVEDVARGVRNYVAPVEQFTCPRCGEHRDTTIAGHCDDCEA